MNSCNPFASVSVPTGPMPYNRIQGSIPDSIGEAREGTEASQCPSCCEISAGWGSRGGRNLFAVADSSGLASREAGVTIHMPLSFGGEGENGGAHSGSSFNGVGKPLSDASRPVGCEALWRVLRGANNGCHGNLLAGGGNEDARLTGAMALSAPASACTSLYIAGGGRKAPTGISQTPAVLPEVPGVATRPACNFGVALTVPDLCAALRVSRGTLSRWMARPDAKTRLHRLTGTRRVLVSDAELTRWVIDNTEAV